MPGVLIDDLPFSLDSVSSSSSPFFESLCGQQASSPSGFYSQAQLGPLLSPLSSSMSEATAKSAFQQQQHQLKFVNMSLDRPPQTEHVQYLDEQHQQHLDAAALWMNASSSSNRFFNGNSNSTSNNNSSSINGDVVKDLLMEAMAASSGSSSCESPRASPTAHEALAAALHKFLPSNNSEEAAWSAEDLYSCDEFRMFEFKVRRCMRGRSHDWTECPFAHPGEKARRRDPRRFHYSGTACPDFRKGNCKNGDACELAHGVFECWLHPARYRTQPCKDGRNCKRRVCFFAHTPEQLRLLPAAAQAAAAVSSTSSGSSCSSPKSSSSLRSGGGSGSPLFRSFSDNNNNSMSGGDRIEGSSGCCCHHHHQFVGSPRHHQLVGGGGSSCSGHSCCRILSSPTSTLVGLAHSPPPLSPPLSPSVSPPLSPSSASLSMSMAASAVARGAVFSSQQQQQQQQSPSPSSAQRRHLERLASLEHQHQQQQQQQRRPLMHSYPSAPSSPGGSSHHHHSPFSSSSSSNHGGSPMSDLVSALQQLELKGAAGGGPMWMQQLAMANQSSSSSSNQQQQYTTGPSPLRPSNTNFMSGNAASSRGCSSISLPGTPTKPRWDCGGMWEMDVGEDEEDEMAAMASPRVESGKDLRAKIYGRLVGKKEAAAAARLEPALGDGFEMEAAVAGEASPDLNWVNELVTE